MAALIAAAAEPVAEIPFVSFEQRGRDPDLRPRRGRDRGRQSAQGSSRRHRADQAAGRHRAAARHRIPGGEGHDPLRQGPSRRVRADGRRLCAAGAVVARRARASAPAKNGATSRCDIILDISGGAPLFSAADLRDGYLRADPGDPAAVMKAVLKARDLTGTFDKPRYIDFHRRHLRAFALEDRRLQSLPRSLPGRRDRARRRSRRDRRAYLRRLRTMRGGVPDRRRLLRAAAGRRADAQAAHAAHDLSRGRRHAAGHPVPRRCARHAADRRAGALRRRAAGERAAGRGQRGDAGRARSARRGVRLWRRGGAAAAARQAAP